MNDPWISSKSPYAAPGDVEADKDPIWSSETGDIGGRRRSNSSDRQTERGTGNKEEDEYELLHGTETEHGHHPGRPWDSSYGAEPSHNILPDTDTGYHGASSAYTAPSALSPSSYSPQRQDGPVPFPTAPHGYGDR